MQAPLPASAPLANAPPGGIALTTKLQTLETIPNLAVLEPDGKTAVQPVQLAAQINAASKIVTASIPKAQATPASAGPAGPQAAATPVANASPWVKSSARFSNGRDATWSEQNYVRTLKAELTTGSARLDEIAPALFNLMCLPDVVWLSAGNQQTVYQAAHEFCRERDAFLIVDPPPPSKGRDRGAVQAQWRDLRRERDRRIDGAGSHAQRRQRRRRGVLPVGLHHRSGHGSGGAGPAKRYGRRRLRAN